MNERGVWEKLGKVNPFSVTSFDLTPDYFLFKIIPKSSFVLDAGCGWGRNAQPLARKHKCRIVGVDLAKSLGKKAKDRNLEIVIADLCHLPFKDGSFDFLISMYVLLHIPSEQLTTVLKEFQRCSKVSIFNIQNAYNLGHMFKKTLYRRKYQPKTIRDGRAPEGWLVSFYTYGKVKTLLKNVFTNIMVEAQQWMLKLRIPNTKLQIKIPILSKKYAEWFVCVCS